MWLMTKHGFYSIVEKQAGEFHVRAREKRDLENLKQIAQLDDAEIVETPHNDYACRIIVGRDEMLRVLAALGENIDYDNFKNEIHDTPDQAHKPYAKVWKVLADALGAYGSKPPR